MARVHIANNALKLQSFIMHNMLALEFERVGYGDSGPWHADHSHSDTPRRIFEVLDNHVKNLLVALLHPVFKDAERISSLTFRRFFFGFNS